MRHILTYLSGLVFGIGIAVSGMINPAKVLNFFDITGTWDPSLAFVMGGALAVAAIGLRIVWRRPAPLFEPGYNLPDTSRIDGKLIAGAAIFGIGWGIAGYCPGAAIPALGTGEPTVFIFTAALIAGIFIAKTMLGRTSLHR